MRPMATRYYIEICSTALTRTCSAVIVVPLLRRAAPNAAGVPLLRMCCPTSGQIWSRSPNLGPFRAKFGECRAQTTEIAPELFGVAPSLVDSGVDLFRA